MKYYYINIVVVSIMLLQGCASKDTVFPDPDSDIKEYIEKNKQYSGNGYRTKKVMPYQTTTSITVGSRANDSKVVVNTGKVFKIYINSYKRGSTLIGGHDIYTYVEKPGFIVGQNVPERSIAGVTTPIGNLPFRINGSQLNINTHETEMSDKDVKNFNNNIYNNKYGHASKKTDLIKKVERTRDDAILNYINAKKGNK